MTNDPEKIRNTVPEHIRYWKYSKPINYSGGPFSDRSGGLILFEAENMEMATKLAPDSLASRYLFFECLHLSDISYWAYWVSLFQRDSLFLLMVKTRCLTTVCTRLALRAFAPSNAIILAALSKFRKRSME